MKYFTFPPLLVKSNLRPYPKSNDRASTTCVVQLLCPHASPAKHAASVHASAHAATAAPPRPRLASRRIFPTATSPLPRASSSRDGRTDGRTDGPHERTRRPPRPRSRCPRARAVPRPRPPWNRGRISGLSGAVRGVRPSSHDRSACVGPAYACSWIDETVVQYDYTPCTVTRVYPNNQVHTDDRPSRPRARAPTAQTRRRTTTTTCPRRRRDNRSRRLSSSSSATGGRVRARDDGRRPTTDEIRTFARETSMTTSR